LVDKLNTWCAEPPEWVVIQVGNVVAKIGAIQLASVCPQRKAERGNP
jgi:hypothetical protein